MSGLWNTSDSWFTRCRSLVQVEFAGTVLNSKPNDDVHSPRFDELFVFPVGEDQQLVAAEGKVFISILTVEGKGDIGEPDPALDGHDPLSGSRAPSDTNVYKRVAEYCLDIGDICEDQLVHELALTIPVPSKQPKAGPLVHALRQIDISGFFNDESRDESCILDFS